MISNRLLTKLEKKFSIQVMLYLYLFIFYIEFQVYNTAVMAQCETLDAQEEINQTKEKAKNTTKGYYESWKQLGIGNFSKQLCIDHWRI